MGIPTEMASFDSWIQQLQRYINESPGMDLIEIHAVYLEIEIPSSKLT